MIRYNKLIRAKSIEYYVFFYIISLNTSTHTRTRLCIFIIFLRAVDIVMMVSCSIRTENECSCSSDREVKSALSRGCVYVFRTLSPSFGSPAPLCVHTYCTPDYIYMFTCVCVYVLAQLFIKNCERAAEKIKESGQKSLRANLYGPFIALGAHRMCILLLYTHPQAAPHYIYNCTELHRPAHYTKYLYTHTTMSVCAVIYYII